MQLLIDVTFLLLAAGGGSATAGLIFWYCAPRLPEGPGSAEQEAQFAHETLTRLQELTQRVAAEVDQHAECVEEINAQLAATSDNDESTVLAAVRQLIQANQHMRRQLDSAEERLQSQALQIESHAVEARTDALTQVANRRALDDALTRCLADFQRRQTPTTVMLLDVDHFKRFNDTHGHQAGDDALRGVARLVRQAVGELGFVARYGGEEFAVVLSGMSGEAASACCERARQAIGARPLRIGSGELRVTASAGVAETLEGDNEQKLLARADAALYASKSAGRNCGHFGDGRTNRLLKARPAVRPATPAPAPNSVGDEWLFEAETQTEALFREPIPNVANRPAFFDDLIRRLAQWRRTGTPLTLLVIQVDAFAQIVTDHGPSCAEAVLRIAAQLINASMRDMDHVARLSEDTFVLLLPGALQADGLTIAQRLRQAVERCVLPRKAGTTWITVSAGVVEADNGDDLRRILQRGRQALAEAVHQGGNRVIGLDASGAAVNNGLATAESQSL